MSRLAMLMTGALLCVVADAPAAPSVAGTRLPTVVLQAGLGDGRDSWDAVLAGLAGSNRVFAHDRPGYGGRAPADGPRDPCGIAAELRETLQASGFAPPYVLVGHSLGGLYQYVFAKLYPADVAGLELLDPTHPDHWRRMQDDAPATAAFMKVMRAVLFSPVMRAEFDDQARCLDRIDTRTPLAVPTRLLVRTEFGFIESGRFAAMAAVLADDWRRLSSATSVHQVVGAGHYIHHDRPDVVVKELEALTRELRVR